MVFFIKMLVLLSCNSNYTIPLIKKVGYLIRSAQNNSTMVI